MKTHFPDPTDLLNFTLTITPDEGAFPLWPVLPESILKYNHTFVLGMYKGGSFVFSFAINTNYPHDPPKVKCTQRASNPIPST